MSAIDNILNRTIAGLPGITVPILEAELQGLLVDFFKQTRAWRADFSDASTSDGVLDVGAIPMSGKVVGIIGVIQHGTERSIVPVGAKPRMSLSPGLQPMVYYNIPNSYARVGFAPELSGEITGLSGQVYLIPLTNSLRTMPDDVLELHTEALLSGLQGRMMRKPGKPFTNMKEGNVLMVEYRMGANQARHQANKGRTTSPEPWRYPGWS